MNISDTGLGARRRTQLSTLWVFVLLNMIYADILSLMDPVSVIRQIMSGAGRVPGGLFVAAILMETSIAMVLLSRVLPRKGNRYANIIAASINIPAVLVGGRGAFYYFFAVIESLAMLAIVYLSVKWPKSPHQERTLPTQQPSLPIRPAVTPRAGARGAPADLVPGL
jgi:hypothetical protein